MPKNNCQHWKIGQQLIEHHGISHPSGENYCFDCGLTIKEIIKSALSSQLTEVEGIIQNIDALKRGKWIMHPDWISRKELLTKIKALR